ncbi:hypothetical protein XHC_0531 [Xanthomonas hortorum pv. carotae str. M081]|nr:hypothetical protein XHC_0531 [Xanthomonas hortorum pv. carotae str. M081]
MISVLAASFQALLRTQGWWALERNGIGRQQVTTTRRSVGLFGRQT